MFDDFDSWYDELQRLAEINSINVADKEAWREAFDDGLEPWATLLEDYPELEDL